MKRVRAILAWACVGVLVSLTVVMIGWRLQGGSWVRVETPSMGTTAPVGTLLWIKPVPFEDLRPGDLISFHPPGSKQTYSHLVSSVNADGTVSTHGKISGQDPWRISEGQVIGRSALVWHGVGWLLVAAPVLVGGALLVWLLVRSARDRSWRIPLAVLGASVVITTAILVYRPLLGAEQISFRAEDGTARATYVGTGLLPVRLSTPQGGSVVLRPGEVGSVTDTTPDSVGAHANRFAVALGPAVPFSWWLVLIVLCFVPALVETLRGRVGLRHRRPRAHAHSSRLSVVGGRHLAVH